MGGVVQCVFFLFVFDVVGFVADGCVFVLFIWFDLFNCFLCVFVLCVIAAFLCCVGRCL